MAHIIVESTHEKPLTGADLEAGRAKLTPCIEERHGKWIRSYLSTDGRRRICHFEAPDAESVREAFRAVGFPVGQVWTCGAVVQIEDYPDFVAKRDQVRARLAGK